MPVFWDTPRRPMIAHTSDSHQIPSQKKTTSDGQTVGENETNIPNNNFVVQGYKKHIQTGTRKQRPSDRHWLDIEPTLLHWINV